LAAWGLKELANSEPIVAQVHERALKFDQQLGNKQADEAHANRQSFLLETLGRNKLSTATELLRQYIPKSRGKAGSVARASAIWALGRILQGSQEAGLAKSLAERMHDESITDPEDELVRYNATIALGWIKAPASFEELRLVPYRPPMPLGVATSWALEQYTVAAAR
jgi:hypothetical protein